MRRLLAGFLNKKVNKTEERLATPADSHYINTEKKQRIQSDIDKERGK